MSDLKLKRSNFKDKTAKVDVDSYDGYATIRYTLNSIADEELTLSNFFEGEKDVIKANKDFVLPLLKKLGLNEKEKYVQVISAGNGQDEHEGYQIKDEKIKQDLIQTINKLVLAETPELKQKVISEAIEEKKTLTRSPRKLKM